jgi:hypothetical protein
MRPLSTTVLSLSLILLAPVPVVAFNYDEHCRISNHALQIAIASVSSRNPAFSDSLASPRLREMLLTQSRCIAPGTGDRTYGDLVSRVDWARAPGDFFLADLPRGLGDITSTDVIPWNRIDALVGSRFQDFRAMHENAEHFGGRALFYFDAWHNQAVTLAAEGNLAGALVHNAFADHYLQDHFAPGHIYTPRIGLTDAITPNMHDFYNRRGAYYRASSTGVLADLLLSVRDSNSIPAPFLDLVNRVCGLGAWTLRGSDLKPCLRRFEESDSLRLRGDGYLKDEPQQALFVTLVMARSLTDVLESWIARTPTEQFGEKRWCGYVPLTERGVDVEQWQSPVATIRYGTYRPEKGKGFPRFDPPLVIATALESVPQTGDTRFSLAGERFFSGWAGSNWLGDESSSGLLGAANTNESTYLGFEVLGRCDFQDGECGGGLGGYLRFLNPVPRINSQVSRFVGARISTPPSGSSGPALSLWSGLGMETGFSILHLGGRVTAEVTVVEGSKPAVHIVFAPTIHAAPPRRYMFPPTLQEPIPTPAPLEDARNCSGPVGSGQGLWISPAPRF